MLDSRPKGHRFITAALCALAVAPVACGSSSSDDQGIQYYEPEDSLVLRAVIDVMGGRAAVEAARNEVIESAGQRFQPGNAPRPGEAVLVADFAANLTTEIGASKLKLDLDSTTRFLNQVSLAYQQTIDGSNGFVEGHESIFSPPLAEPTPILSSRITAQLRQADLASPLRLVRRALAEPSAISEEDDAVFAGRQHKVLRFAPADELPLRLFVDPDSFVLAKAETVEDHPPLGDSLVEAIYGDYRPVDGLLLPFHLSMQVDGIEILSEERSSIAIDDDDVDYTVPPELIVPFDEALGDVGRRSAEWLLGFEYLGLPDLFYVDQTPAQVTMTELAPGVVLVPGPSHNQLVIEMSDHLILVDTPLYEERSVAVLAAIRQRFPGKPIRDIILSHFHHDHSGGIRHYAAEGGVTVWAQAVSAEFYREVMSNPHTVRPDRLQEAPVPVAVEPVDQLQTLTDGKRTVEIHRVTTIHSDDMLIVYLPAEKFLYNTDLFGPGRALPLPSPFDVWAGELLDEVTRLGLDIELIAAAHGTAPATLADLEDAAGRGRR